MDKEKKHTENLVRSLIIGLVFFICFSVFSNGQNTSHSAQESTEIEYALDSGLDALPESRILLPYFNSKAVNCTLLFSSESSENIFIIFTSQSTSSLRYKLSVQIFRLIKSKILNYKINVRKTMFPGDYSSIS